jgi:hypothetical protein
MNSHTGHQTLFAQAIYTQNFFNDFYTHSRLKVEDPVLNDTNTRI